ncbi:MAG: DUF4013 domain-containing protein [Acidobacteriota bacterium]
MLVGGALETLPFVLGIALVAAFLSAERTDWTLVASLAPLALVSLACRFAVLGYLRRVARGILDGTLAEPPSWARPGALVVDGLSLWLVSLALWLPALVVAVTAVALATLAGSTEAVWLPAVLAGGPAALATVFLLPACLLAAVEGESVALALDLRSAAARIARTPGSYTAACAFALATEVLAHFGLLLLVVGLLVTRFAAHVMAVHAFASAWRSMPAPAAEGIPD